VLHSRHIVDRYLLGTQLRLRVLVETGREQDEDGREYKLTQKVPDPVTGTPRRMTTMYLSRAAYDLVATLPAAELSKVRLSIAPFGVDVFQGRLEGLVLAECEAADATELARYASPAGSVAEVTEDDRFSGGRLAMTPAPELGRLLAEFGLPVPARS
jgi:CYTH domain-containing protein